jgi:hypothetical protein
MGKSYTETNTNTRITDLSQIAEGETIAGTGSIVGGEGTTIGQGGSFTVTGANADKVISDILTNQDSTVGKLLGLSDQLAQGIFEVAPAAAAQAAVASQPSAIQPQPAGQAGTNTLIVIAGIGLLLILLGSK